MIVSDPTDPRWKAPDPLVLSISIKLLLSPRNREFVSSKFAIYTFLYHQLTQLSPFECHTKNFTLSTRQRRKSHTLPYPNQSRRHQ